MGSTIKRKRRSVPAEIVRSLWVRSGGRCAYCNVILYRDGLIQTSINKAYISHIIAAKKDYTRGDPNLSQELETKYSNLLLLCDECHNRIDKAEPERHTVEFLRHLKKEHEDRIEFLTSIKPEKKSNVITFTAKIGKHMPVIDFNDVSQALLPEFYPNSHKLINLGVDNYPSEDNQDNYWETLNESLKENFKKKMNLISENAPNHYSVFGMAPQPLLIKLGVLLSDIRNVKVYTKLREPDTWRYQNDDESIDFELLKPENNSSTPVLIISVSVKIDYERVYNIMGKNISIWEIVVPEPGNDIVRSEETLVNFRRCVRSVFKKVRLTQKRDTALNIFPAMPNSLAIEFGRVWQPKAEIPMILYDQNSKRDGFIKTIEIRN